MPGKQMFSVMLVVRVLRPWTAGTGGELTGWFQGHSCQKRTVVRRVGSRRCIRVGSHRYTRVCRPGPGSSKWS